MGWNGLVYSDLYYNEKGQLDRKKTMDKIYEEVLVRSALVGRFYYAALKRDDGTIYGLVVKTEKDRGEFSYKPIHENEGPYYYDCPNSILKLLSPTDNEFALKWRKLCKEKEEFKKKMRTHPKRIKFKVPYNLGYYKKGEEIILNYVLTPMKYKNKIGGYYTDGNYRFPSTMLNAETVTFMD